MLANGTLKRQQSPRIEHKSIGAATTKPNIDSLVGMNGKEEAVVS